MFNVKIRRAGLAMVFCLLFADSARASEELYRKVVPSTVLVYKNYGLITDGGSGTGFLIDAQERLVITARHVVERTKGGITEDIVVLFPQFKDGEIITESRHYHANYKNLAIRAKVVYENVRRDMAVLQLERLPEGVKALELAGTRARPGQTVHFIGNSTERFGCVFSYCQGYVRNAFRYEPMGANIVATQAPTNKGDSGGPMLNNLGEILGIAIMSTTGTSLPKENTFHDVQVTELSLCVTEIRDALQEMRQGSVAKATPVKLESTEIKANIHFVRMEKDVVYRISIKAEGFNPELRIDNNLMAAKLGQEANHYFTPSETREFRIQVGHLPGQPIDKGSLPYTLSLEKVDFEADNTLKDQLKTNEHVRKLEAGKNYRISVRAKGFEPDLQVLEGGKSVANMLCDGRVLQGSGATAEYDVALNYTPARSGDHRIVVAIGPFSPTVKGQLDYVVSVVEQTALFIANDQLTMQQKSKVHTFKLEAGKTYAIELNTEVFDSKLTLEDPAGKELKQGEDFGKFGARLVFSPPATGTYRIMAGSHGDSGTGAYTIAVTEVAPGKMPDKK